MKKVEKYEANDGELFDTEEECVRYEKELELAAEYSKGIVGVRLFGGEDQFAPLPFSRIFQWAKNNKEFFKKIADAL